MCCTKLLCSICSGVEGIYVADPRSLGPGMHVLMIFCQDRDFYVATSNVKFVLDRPHTAGIITLFH